MLGNVWDGIEALAALERFGTVSEAATRLRVTQSAVSKRLQALSREVGYPVIEPAGRRVVITPQGLDLLERARPLLAGLRDLAAPRAATGGTLSLALADSIASSWGPGVVADALEALGGLRIELHAHRTVLLVESVRLGRYQAGLATEVPTGPDLVLHRVVEEPMVLVHGGQREAPLVTIEPRSATWEAIEPVLRRRHRDLLARRIEPVETFTAALQMVRAGFGDGLVPLGVALGADLPAERLRVLDDVRRPIALVTRKAVHHLPRFAELREALVAAARRAFARGIDTT